MMHASIAPPPRAAQLPGELDDAIARVRLELAAPAAAAAALGMPTLRLEGQLIRPLVAYAARRTREQAEAPGFWTGALALQMAHEASLVHDDIIDGAQLRRSEPTVVAARGVGGALVLGDHLLTSAYRMAAATGSARFVELFSRAVERTVAGELAQARATGLVLDLPRYAEIVTGKSGELLGCALALEAAVEGRPDAEAMHALGRRLGLLYQMLDDLLDYCPGAPTGKPALGDYAQRRWTWPLVELPGIGFGLLATEVVDRLFAQDGGAAPAVRCLERLDAEFDATGAALREALGERPVLAALLEQWRARGREAVDGVRHAAAGRASPSLPSAALRERVPGPEAVARYLGLHSRSFRFAARLFPAHEAEQVARVYAFCRVTDDIVDRPGEGAADASAELLEEWVELARQAYRGRASGLAFLDRTMEEMATARVPFSHAEELVEGMRMDLRGEQYASLAELRRYTHRVASVVGLWLTELAGVREPWVLERAAALGHAMQLTNILRDVGEDARQGRVYLPTERLASYGLDVVAVREMTQGRRPIGPAYRALVEELLQVAESQYQWAFAAIPQLPRSHWRPVAVAAHVYRGIHASIRRRGYDNLSHRARTTAPRKVALALGALLELRRVAARERDARTAAARPAMALITPAPLDAWRPGAGS